MTDHDEPLARADAYLTDPDPWEVKANEAKSSYQEEQDALLRDRIIARLVKIADHGGPSNWRNFLPDDERGYLTTHGWMT